MAIAPTTLVSVSWVVGFTAGYMPKMGASLGLLSCHTSLLWALCEGDIYAQFLPLAEDGECYLVAHAEAP